MRSLFCILILFSLLVFNSGHAQWEQVSNGLFGGSVSSMCFCDSGFFIGTYRGGMFKSTNYGESWFSINEGLSTLTIHDLIYVNGYIIAATEDKINYSTNYRDSWSSSEDKLSSSISSLVSFENFILACNSSLGNGIIISENNGKDWTKISNRETLRCPLLLKVYGNDIFAGTCDGFYLSQDTGKSWERIENDTTYCYVYDFVVNDSYIFLIANNLGGGIVRLPKLFRSSDYGKNWEEIGCLLREEFINNVSNVSEDLFVATHEGLYSSSNNGESWNKFNSINSIYNMFTHDDYIFLTTFNDEIFRSTDFGNSWTNTDKGITALYIDRLSNIGNKIVAGSSFRSFYTINDGERWHNECFDSCNYSITSIVKKGDSYYAGTRSNGVFKSTDGGIKWFCINDGLTNLKINKLINVNDNILVSTGDYLEKVNGVFLLNPDCISWQVRSNGLTDKLVTDFVNIGPVIFAGTRTKGIFKTDDYGISWTPVEINLKLYTQTITCLAVLGNSIYAGTSNDGLLVSTDLGKSWEKTWDKEYDAISNIIVNGNTILISISWKGVFKSTNGGKSWSEFNKGLINKHITCLLLTDGYLYAGTNGSGVWRYKIHN